MANASANSRLPTNSVDHSLTHREHAFYSRRTTQDGLNALEINDLEAKIDTLIKLCDDLEQKIATLQADKDDWSREKTRLMEKNDLARTKVEAMIMRLKALEQE